MPAIPSSENTVKLTGTIAVPKRIFRISSNNRWFVIVQEPNNNCPFGKCKPPITTLSVSRST